VVLAPGLPERLRLRVELVDLDRVVASTERPARRSSERAVESDVRVLLPDRARHGYGLHLTVRDGTGRIVARRTSAVEALQGWWESPRHACITEFGPDVEPAAVIDGLVDWHVNVVQFYDWMFRHYRYSPPSGEVFVDALGRIVSHRTVRAAVTASQARGIAALAYGSVYGAEREYVDDHPAELLRDTEGRPLSLGGTFFITDLRPGSPWRERLLQEYERACRRFGFDGIHMDQYGQPHDGIAADGSQVDLEAVFPGLIEEADRRMRATSRHRRVLFNAVDGWPLDAVAPAATAATYIEVWPPDDRYSDLVRIVDQARLAGPGKAIVVAAYLSALRAAGGDPARRRGAIEGLILLSSVLLAAGAYHHVLAEQDRILVEGYYPEAQPIGRREARALRAAWRFSARYLHLLSNPSAEILELDGLELSEASGRKLDLATTPLAGHVWVRGTRTAGGRETVQFVDLRSQSDDLWDAERESSPVATGWRVRWRNGPRRLMVASPWSASGDPRVILVGGLSDSTPLPTFRRWAMLVAG
jgi:dextranase